MNNSRLKFSLTKIFVSAIVLIVVRISSKETKSSVGFDVNSAIFQKDNHENVRGCFDLLNTDVNYLIFYVNGGRYILLNQEPMRSLMKCTKG
jgi:hypothetical protein